MIDLVLYRDADPDTVGFIPGDEVARLQLLVHGMMLTALGCHRWRGLMWVRRYIPNPDTLSVPEALKLGGRLLWDGKAQPTLTLALNTAIVLGSQAVNLAALAVWVATTKCPVHFVDSAAAHLVGTIEVGCNARVLDRHWSDIAVDIGLGADPVVLAPFGPHDDKPAMQVDAFGKTFGDGCSAMDLAAYHREQDRVARRATRVDTSDPSHPPVDDDWGF